MKVLVTGASGFIGSHLTARLRADGIAFDVVRRVSSGTPIIDGKQEDGVKEVRWPDDILSLNLSGYTAVIHLALAPSTQCADYSSLRRSNIAPVQNFLTAIERTNPNCSLVFVSSQSAKPSTDSMYGRLKWEAEQIIKSSSVCWTIVRPGLVVGPGAKGLFNRMLTFVRLSPVVPLIGRGEQLIQPISVKTVIEALVLVAKISDRFSRREIPLVIEPVSFKDFLQRTAERLGKKRLFIPVPERFISFALGCCERIFKNPPITRTNLLGLLNLEVLDSRQAYELLPSRPESLEEILDYALSTPARHSLAGECRVLYWQLFRTPSPERVVERYVQAHQFYCIQSKPEQDLALEKILKLGLDVESIEYATRGSKTVLSKKLALVLYLAEIEPGNYERYINSNSSWILGMMRLSMACGSAPWKMVKGRYLVWRYGLV